MGETIYNNSGAIKSAGSSAINTIGNVGSNVFNNLSSSGVLDTVGSVGSTLAETAGGFAGDVISELL